MKKWDFVRRGLATLTVVYIAAVLQGCLTVKCDGCCDGEGGLGQGYCAKHRMGSWPTDFQNYPNCTVWSTTNNSWVCSNLNGNCADAATPNGKCKLSPSSGTCDCKCM